MFYFSDQPTEEKEAEEVDDDGNALFGANEHIIIGCCAFFVFFALPLILYSLNKYPRAFLGPVISTGEVRLEVSQGNENEKYSRSVTEGASLDSKVVIHGVAVIGQSSKMEYNAIPLPSHNKRMKDTKDKTSMGASNKDDQSNTKTTVPTLPLGYLSTNLTVKSVSATLPMRSVSSSLSPRSTSTTSPDEVKGTSKLTVVSVDPRELEDT